MKRRITLLILVAIVFVSSVFVIKQISGSILLSNAHKLEVSKFEILTDATETAPIRREILLSSPLIILGKGDATPFTPTQVIAATNRQRVAQNLPELQENQLLATAAEEKVRDMFEHQYFEHISPTGKGPGALAADVGYEYVSLGENLALGNFGDEEALVEAWMESPGHRANILRPQFQEIGIAIGRGEYQGRQVIIAVQEFGRPLESCPRVSLTLKKSIDADKESLNTISNNLKKEKDAITVLENSSSRDQAEYEAKVAEYNTQVAAYNTVVATIKQKTATYNTQVKAFNACLKSSV